MFGIRAYQFVPYHCISRPLALPIVNNVCSCLTLTNTPLRSRVTLVSSSVNL